MPENVQIVIIRTHFEEKVFGSVPLIEHLLDQI